MRAINSWLWCFLLAIGGLWACAHRSGHDRSQRAAGRAATSDTRQTNRANKPNTRAVPTVASTANEAAAPGRPRLEGATIFARYNTAVFMIFTSDGYRTYQGSGFFISKDGLAVSNYHVFKNTGVGIENIKLPGSDKAYKVAEVIQYDEQEDFILFRVDVANTNCLPIARSRPRVGEKVYAIGSPRGLENTFSSGEVSQWRDQNLMQISALIDHGSSGGALVNEYGEVVGITSGTFVDGSQANLNYAWSIDIIKPFVRRK